MPARVSKKRAQAAVVAPDTTLAAHIAAAIARIPERFAQALSADVVRRRVQRAARSDGELAQI